MKARQVSRLWPTLLGKQALSVGREAVVEKWIRAVFKLTRWITCPQCPVTSMGLSRVLQGESRVMYWFKLEGGVEVLGMTMSSPDLCVHVRTRLGYLDLLCCDLQQVCCYCIVSLTEYCVFGILLAY